MLVRSLVMITAARTAKEQDPDKAMLLLADIEELARTIADPRQRIWELREIAEAMTSVSPPATVRLMTDIEAMIQTLPEPDKCSEELAQTARLAKALDTAAAKRLLSDAERAAQSVVDPSKKARALRRVADTVIGIDDSMARRLVGEIELLAARIGTPNLFEEAAEAIAELDPLEAIRITEGVRDEEGRAWILWHIARDISDRDRGAALQLLAEAQRLSHAAKDYYGLENIVGILAQLDLELAEKAARAIPDAAHHCGAVRNIVKALDGRDPGRARRLLAEAEYLARDIGFDQRKTKALCEIALLLITSDIAHAQLLLTEAERVANTITSPWDNSGFLQAIEKARIDVAKLVSVKDPREAQRIAQGLDRCRDEAVLEVAKVIGLRSVDEAVLAVRAITGHDERMQALRDLAVAVASRNLDEAQRVADMISNPQYHAEALVRIAAAAAQQDPGWI
jgi:hypothetical protein